VKRIALAGNPNCGKTTIFNALTGLKYKVANYPGVTVEKKEGTCIFPELADTIIIDLPGIYSLQGNSIDEAIAAKSLLGEIKEETKPDIIVSVIDASNLERNLYLTTQLLDLGAPMILVLNMTDLAEKDGLSIKQEILSRLLDVPVTTMTANKGRGLDELVNQIKKIIINPSISNQRYAWLKDFQAYKEIASELGKSHNTDTKQYQEDTAILIGSGLLSEAYQAKNTTHKQIIEEKRALLLKQNIDCFSFEATQRYQWINSIIKNTCAIDKSHLSSFSEKIDSFITHKFWGSLVFLAIMAFIFQSIFLWASYPMDLIDNLFQKISSTFAQILPDGQIKSLVCDGIIGGVGSVVIFVPQIAVLFFFLGLLEDTGYLSRAAFLMDKIMRRFGLQGRSFIPLLSSFACAIPGIMSTRTIPSFSDRMTTIMVAPLMSCSARLPVYTLLIAAFIPQTYILGLFSLQGLVLLGMYTLGVVGALVIAWLLKFSLLRGEPALFVMEMPRFRAPSLKNVLREVWDRVVVFIKSAGTIILACSIVLWFLASYPKGDIKDSYAGRLGHTIEPIIKPLGFNWEIGIGIIASFAAREVFVTSLSTVYNLEDNDTESQTLVNRLKEKRADNSFSLASALSLMVFYVFACQCMSTLAICRKETASWWWPGFMFAYMTVLAYITSLVTYRIALTFLT
jgi:ferrous iron transport protein B